MRTWTLESSSRSRSSWQLKPRGIVVAMPGTKKKTRTRWDSDEERKLIEVWADILQETDGRMLTRKKKEGIATQRVNLYIKNELAKNTMFSEKEVRNKIDWMLKKGKQFFTLYQKKGETGKEVDDEFELDHEAAEAAWPNFKIFYTTFKGHPSLGPGVVEDSSVIHETAPTKRVNSEQDAAESSGIDDTTETQAGENLPSIDSGDDDEDEDPPEDPDESSMDPSLQPPPKKQKSSRVQKTVEKGSGSFLSQYEKIQKTSQISMMEHEQKMQRESMAFQAKLEQDRLRFEGEISQKMQHDTQQFQQQMMQQNQLFQAELYSRDCLTKHDIVDALMQ